MTEVVPGLWQFTARHPEWTEDEGGDEDGWEPDVNWWVRATPGGALLIDPLVEDWGGLDALVAARGGCAGILRTCKWHQRSVPEAAARYGAEVWGARETDGTSLEPLHRELGHGEQIAGGIEIYYLRRRDEVALWLAEPATLIFADAMIRAVDGRLAPCPPTWSQPVGGRSVLLDELGELAAHRPRHVLVSHGPLVVDDGEAALRRALG